MKTLSLALRNLLRNRRRENIMFYMNMSGQTSVFST